MVDAIENEQMAIYAKSILEEQFSMGLLDRDPNMRISMTIVQPRAKDGETRKTWNVTLAQLEEFVAPIEAVAKDILANPTNQPFAPSDDNCRFCDAEPFCTARSGSFFEALPAETAEIQVSETFTVPPVETLTKDQQVRLLKAAPTLRKFLEKLETYVEDALTADPNWTTEFKLVESNPHRKWSSEKEALTLLQPKLGLDVVMPRKLISPSAAEKALKEAKIELSTRFVNRFAEIAVKPPGQTTMVPASDKRPALNIAHDFQPITDFSADMLD